jgi:hypothetical protein
MDDKFDMTEIRKLGLIGSYPNTVVYLTDPGLLTHSSIDLSSQSGDKVVCDAGSICSYEINILVTDLSTVSPDTCSDETSFKRCVEEQTKHIYNEVIDKEKSCFNLET